MTVVVLVIGVVVFGLAAFAIGYVLGAANAYQDGYEDGMDA